MLIPNIQYWRQVAQSEIASFFFALVTHCYWGGVKRFDNYYKRRINRIYPSVFAAVVVMLSLGYYSFASLTIEKVLGGEFIIAIMIYYVLLWFVSKYFRKNIPWIFVFVMLITLVAYYYFPYKYETGVHGLYGISTLFRWIPYFGVMLLGAYIGLTREHIKFNIRTDFLKFIVCLIAFYSIQFAAKKINYLAPFQIVTIPFLFGVVYYFYKCCNADIFKRLYGNKCWNTVILSIGGLCLESYLIQYCVITDKLNFLFPMNIPFIFIGVLLLSYFTRCAARIFSQTFKEGNYEWGKVFSLK